MNNIELALNTRIEDLLNIMESANYGLDREITYYKLIRDNISEICKDLNLVNNIHNSITYNRNIILDNKIIHKFTQVSYNLESEREQAIQYFNKYIGGK